MKSVSSMRTYKFYMFPNLSCFTASLQFADNLFVCARAKETMIETWTNYTYFPLRLLS